MLALFSFALNLADESLRIKTKRLASEIINIKNDLNERTMNKIERLMNERMNFVSHRGRSAEWQRAEWLKRMRAERKIDNPYDVIVNGWAWYDAKTIRQAKIIGLSIVNGLIANNLRSRRDKGNFSVEIYDKNTQILLWEAIR